jgi:hypothetical protein
MGATRNTGYLENLIQYDASDNVAIATSVNPSYKVTLGGSLFGTSATFNVGSATTVLGLTGNGDGATIASITNTNTGTAGRSSFQVTSDSSTAHFFASSSTNVSTATGGRASTAGIFTASGDTAGGLAFLARNAAGVITFHTGGNTERVRIAANGAATFSSSVTAGGTISITGNFPIVLNSIPATTSQQLQYQNNGTNKWQLYLNTTNNSFNFYNSTNTTDRVTILESGNVGIGTTSPSGVLHVRSAGITASAPSLGWPVYNAEADTNARSIYIDTGGNNAVSTGGQGASVVVQFGQTFDSRVVITPLAAGSQTPSDQGAGRGRDMMIKAGTSDNTNGYKGGRLYLNGGMGYQGAYNANGGDIIMQALAGSGNVGIGVTTPGLPLDIWINSATAYSSTSRGNVLRVYNSNTSANIFAGIELGGEGTGNSGTVGINGVVTANGSAAMTFYTRDSSTFAERMRITSGGNLQFNPASIGDLNNSIFANSNGYMYVEGGTNGLILSNNSVQDCRIRIEDNNNIQFETSSTERLRINSAGDMELKGRATNATYSMYFYSDDSTSRIYSSGSSAVNKDIVFYTQGNPRMTITSGGNVLINTTSDTGYKLQVNGVSQFRDTSVVTKVVGSSYSQTSTSGSTSIVNTGIFYNTSIVGFGNMSSYLVTVRGNPNASGSGSYAAVIIGYITIVTGYDFGISSVIQQISWTEIVNKQPPNIASISVSVVFWNGTTESTQQTDGNTSNQIRIKVSGYNTSFVGSNQDIRITKVTD